MRTCGKISICCDELVGMTREGGGKQLNTSASQKVCVGQTRRTPWSKQAGKKPKLIAWQAGRQELRRESSQVSQQGRRQANSQADGRRNQQIGQGADGDSQRPTEKPAHTHG